MNTEEQILKAAEKEFMQKGFAGARTTSIAAAAGVTHAMMHYYFRSKEKLFEKVLLEKMSLIREIILGTIGDSSLPLFERVTKAIETHFDFLAENPDLPRFLMAEVFCDVERMDIMIQQLRDTAPKAIANLQSQINDYANRGECRNVEAIMLILDIISLNIFCFMAAPVLNNVFKGVLDRKEFLELRKKENVDTIIRKLKP